MRRNVIETVVAGVVILVAAAFLVFVVDQTRAERIDGYPLWARFADVPTLRPGAQVRIAGVPVGRVTGLSLDQERYEVRVEFEVRQDVALASDTKALIGFDGLLGGAIVVLEPGRGSEILKPGDRIRDTESPVNVVDQIGRFIYGEGGAGGAVDDF